MKAKLNKVRLSFPVLWEPKEFKTGDGKPRYSASLVVEKGSENDKIIEAAIKAAAAEKFGAKAEKMLKDMRGQKNQFCYREGDDEQYGDGMLVLACHRKAADGRPTILDRNKAPLTSADGKPYAGCYVNAVVEIYAQTGDNPGIRASFSGLQFAADGEAFGGGRPASADDFDDLGEGADAEDMS